MRVDLNCDLGEGAGHDAALMPLITSANIACGGHAGDDATMRATVRLAQRHGVAIGAHPGFADRANFGRRELALSPAEIQVLVVGQTRQLAAVASAEGAVLRHVKPHGALYNLAARDRAVADAVAAAVRAVDASLVLVGLAGSQLLAAGAAAGLATWSEVFADRSYQADGSLTPRTQAGAVLSDAATAAAQVLQMIREGTVTATNGARVPIRADSICLHGDGPDPVAFATRIVAALRAEQVELGVGRA